MVSKHHAPVKDAVGILRNAMVTPRDGHVDTCAEAARNFGAGTIIALGDGSAMGVGKLAAAIAGVEERLATACNKPENHPCSQSLTVASTVLRRRALE